MSYIAPALFKREKEHRTYKMATTKTLTIDDQTYRRLASIQSEMSHEKKRDVDLGDVINELINIYHDHLAFSGENAGG